MKRCIIICAYNEFSIKSALNITTEDYVICADGGLKLAVNEQITPNTVIGDFDSLGEVPKEYSPIVLPKEKDDTDTLYCVKYAIDKGFKDIYIVGGIGGRLDQTIANIQTLKFAKEKGCNIWLCDKNNKVTYIANNKIEIEKQNSLLSVFSYSKECKNVTIKGTKYELINATLYNNFPIGVSNEFKDDKAVIEVENGELLIILSRD